MNGPSQEQVVLAGPQYQPVYPQVVSNTTIPDEMLWGGNVRRIMGILQIVCGGIEFVFGIAIMATTYYFHIDYVGWGIWNALYAIVTGILGALSVRKRSMVIAYMVTSIIASVLTAGCLMYAISGSLVGGYGAPGRLALYILLSIVFLSQMVISIVGASFTCGVVCSTNNQPQQMIRYTTQPLPQQNAPTPPYTVVTSQSGSANSAFLAQKI